MENAIAFPFNGVVIEDHQRENAILSCYVLRYGTFQISAFGTWQNAYNWEIYTRTETATEIRDRRIGATFPVCSRLFLTKIPDLGFYFVTNPSPIPPYWIPVTGNKIVDFAKQPYPLVFNYNDLVATTPLETFEGYGKCLIVPTGALIPSNLEGLPKLVNLRGKFMKLPRPFVSDSLPFRIVGLDFTFLGTYEFVVEKPILTQQDIINLRLEAERKCSELVRMYPSKYWAAGTLVGSRISIFRPDDPWNPQEIYNEQLLYGSTWVEYFRYGEQSYIYAGWLARQFPLIPATLYSPVLFLVSPRAFTTEIFLTEELCDAINRELGYEAIKPDRIRVFGIWPVGSFSIEHRFVGQIWFPQVCLVEGWIIFDGTKYITKGSEYYRLVFDYAFPVPTFMFLWYAKAAQLFGVSDNTLQGSSWTIYRGWDFEERWIYRGSSCLTATYFPAAIETLPSVSFESVVEAAARVIEKLSRRVVVLASGLNTPFVYYNHELGRMWKATGYIGWQLGPRSPELERRVWRYYPILFGFVYGRNGLREAYGSRQTHFSWVGSYFRSFSEPLYPIDTMRSWVTFTTTVVPCQPWMTGVPSAIYRVVNLSALSNFPQSVPIRNWREHERLMYYAGLPVEAAKFGTHVISFSLEASNEHSVEPPIVTAQCDLKTIAHDNTLSLIASIKIDTDFKQWVRHYIAFQGPNEFNNPISLAIAAFTTIQGHRELFSIDTGIDDDLPMIPSYSGAMLLERLYRIFRREGILEHAFFMNRLHYAYSPFFGARSGFMFNPILGSYCRVGFFIDWSEFKTADLPPWLTLYWIGASAEGRSFYLPLPGYAHAHPATFTQLGRMIDLGSLRQLAKPFWNVVLDSDSSDFKNKGSCILNTVFGAMPAFSLQIGIDPLYLSAMFYSADELPSGYDSTLEEIDSYFLSFPPQHWDPYLRSYESNFKKLEEAPLESEGSPLADKLAVYIRGTNLPVAVGNPLKWTTVNWDFARLLKFTQAGRLPFPVYPLPLEWRLFYYDNLNRLPPLPELIDYNMHGVVYKPYTYFHGIDPASLEKQLARLKMPALREVIAIVACIRTKAGVPVTVTPFGVKFPHKWIRFNEILLETTCFYVNAYPLIDGNIVAHIYTGSGVHTYVVDGERILKYAFDPLPLHALDLLKIRR